MLSQRTGGAYVRAQPNFPKQTGNENGICGAAPGWKNCAADPEKCDANQTAIMNTYIDNFTSIMSGAPTYAKVRAAVAPLCGADSAMPCELISWAVLGAYRIAECSKTGNGAFIHSCHTHCEAQSNAWNSFKVNGMSMQQLHSKWWNSGFTQPAMGLTSQPCQYHTDKMPRMCNPTCGAR